MNRKLRSNSEYGNTRWATRRALWRALGLTDDDMAKPKIAIVNSSSDLAICYSHLDGIAARMKQAVRAAGGVAFEVRTCAPSDFVTSWGHKGGYILSARDLITNDIEVQVEGALLDGMICLASCDKTPPGQLMAAGRLNIPTLIFCCGYQPSGTHRGQVCDIEDVFATAGGLAFGKVSTDEIKAMGDVAIRGPGVCAGMGTANTMHAACEALGMSLPGSTPILANSARMWEFVERAGARIVEMVDEDLRPRDILTAEAFENAVMVMLSISGSINSAKHLAAVAREAECAVDVYRLYERYGEVIPLLTAVRPNGDRTTEEFEAAGGTRAVMKQLEPFLRGDARTVTGRTLGENLSGFTVADEEVIRPASRPLGTHPTIVMLRGSLCPETCIVKLSVTERRNLSFRGPAIVFETALAAIEGIQRGVVAEGQAIVVRGLGPKGTPGMGMASAVVFAVLGAGLAGRVAVVTDGQLSGLTNVGITLAEAQPEAAAGGPIGLVENGDMIAIDISARVANLEVSEDELARRRLQLSKWDSTDERGWLAIYRKLVGPLNQGAILER
ncbi:dihydroxy-acid dehydratase [Bradyrhizobium sp.]|uniref:dihydroxy-acid dehydratase n=1 Tax=Bradyrhizobium sp. TaxID=376 RepID=UPI001EBA22A9|nr:dihydroxy-acid dehydratase [Bradyrhizobium sp.]MBV9983302.1 dihydroxy-acid dehydratase [Bradyrhizobium sp.]